MTKNRALFHIYIATTVHTLKLIFYFLFSAPPPPGGGVCTSLNPKQILSITNEEL